MHGLCTHGAVRSSPPGNKASASHQGSARQARSSPPTRHGALARETHHHPHSHHQGESPPSRGGGPKGHHRTTLVEGTSWDPHGGRLNVGCNSRRVRNARRGASRDRPPSARQGSRALASMLAASRLGDASHQRRPWTRAPAGADHNDMTRLMRRRDMSGRAHGACAASGVCRSIPAPAPARRMRSLARPRV